MAAGRPGRVLGLGSPRTEGPSTPCVEAVTPRRVAGSFRGYGQQTAEITAPEGSEGHGEVFLAALRDTSWSDQ